MSAGFWYPPQKRSRTSTGFVDQRLLVPRQRVLGVEMQRMHLDRVAVRRAREILRRVAEIDERVEALVHPRIQPLVRPDDHREPLVAELVRDHPLLVFARRDCSA